MFDSLLSSVISVDGDLQTIRLYTVSGDEKDVQSHVAETFKARAIDDKFFESIRKILTLNRERFGKNNRVALLLPDSLFFTDTIKIPVIQKKAMISSLGVAVSAIYKNAKDLKYKTFPLSQNKQVAIYGLTGLREDVYEKIVCIVQESGYSVEAVTFNSNAFACGAAALSAKLKANPYFLINVKKDITEYVFVIGGKAVGYYSIPFGTNDLERDSVINESSIFDNAKGEWLVQNAIDSAKKSHPNKLPVDDYDVADEDDDFFEVDKEKTRKSGKRLPKFMLRPDPTSMQDVAYENFRIVLKWALEIIANNDDLTAAAMPKNILVNVDKKFYFLFDKIKEEGGSPFSVAPLFAADVDQALARNLELYGGLYIKKYNKQTVL